MNSANFEERVSNIQILERNLNILTNDSMVKTPYPSIKSLFYDTKPKNRKNLKKLDLIKTQNGINGKINNTKRIKRATIESIINNSKTSEFLSSDYPYHSHKPKLVYIQDYPNQNSTSSLYIVKPNNNGRISNNLKKNNDEISNPIKNNNLNKSINSLPVMQSKKTSKMSNDVSIQKTVNLNDLYKEFIENVSIYIFYFNIIYY